jgi:hypothetical protein
MADKITQNADGSLNVTATQAYVVDIPALVGGGAAYVGFTAGTGGLSAIQNILGWKYSSPSITTLPPTNLTADGGNGRVALKWDAVAGAAAYDIYRGTSPGGEGGTPIKVGVTGTAFNDIIDGYAYELTLDGGADEEVSFGDGGEWYG